MATWDDVRMLALALPETTERPAYGNDAWRVRDKLFVWNRPLRAGERAGLGEAAADGPILGVRVADLGEKQALIEQDGAVFFTIPHFDGYPSVLVRLDRVEVDRLAEIVTDAWLARAPKRLVEDYLSRNVTPED